MGRRMKVWIDQDLCTGDGLCEEIAPDVFVGLDDGLFYVKEGDKVFAKEYGNEEGAQGLAIVPKGQEEAVIESAEECPGECIMIEPN
jgi:ferredoxin